MAEKNNPVEEMGALYTRQLGRPVNYEGKEIRQLSFDFDKLTGKDAMAIEGELRTQGTAVIVPSLSPEFLIRMAARCCTEKIGADIFEQMSIRDFNAIRSRARTFLLDAEL